MRPPRRPSRPADCCAPPPTGPVPGGGAAVRWAARLSALAEPTRLAIVERLAAAPAAVCVCDFVACFGLSQPTVSHHLAVLRAAGLVTSVRKGRWAYYRLERGALRDLVRGLARLTSASRHDQAREA